MQTVCAALAYLRVLIDTVEEGRLVMTEKLLRVRN